MEFPMTYGSFTARDIKFWTMPASKHCAPGAFDLIVWSGLSFRSSFGPRIRRRSIKAMRISSEILQAAITAGVKTLQSIVDLESQIAKAADLIVNCLTSGKKVLACGNGGGAPGPGRFLTQRGRRLVQERPPQPPHHLWRGGGVRSPARKRVSSVRNSYRS